MIFVHESGDAEFGNDGIGQVARNRNQGSSFVLGHDFGYRTAQGGSPKNDDRATCGAKRGAHMIVRLPPCAVDHHAAVSIFAGDLADEINSDGAIDRCHLMILGDKRGVQKVRGVVQFEGGVVTNNV